MRGVRAIAAELRKYDEKLYRKPRWFVLNKIDLVPADARDALLHEFDADCERRRRSSLCPPQPAKGVENWCWRWRGSLRATPEHSTEEGDSTRVLAHTLRTPGTVTSVIAAARRVIVKIGSSSVTADGRGLDHGAIDSWARQIVALRAGGKEVLLCRAGRSRKACNGWAGSGARIKFTNYRRQPQWADGSGAGV